MELCVCGEGGREGWEGCELYLCVCVCVCTHLVVCYSYVVCFLHVHLTIMQLGFAPEFTLRDQ